MSSFAIILVLGSALLHALKAFLVKVSHHKVAYAWAYVAFGQILLTPIAIWLWLQDPPDFGLPVYLLLITSFFHGFYTLSRSVLFETADLSFAYPITQSAPVLITAWYLITGNERLTLYGVLGIALIMIGSLIIQSTQKKTSGWKNFFSKKNKELFLAFITTCLIAGYSITDDLIVDKINAFLLTYLLGIPILAVLTPYLIAKKEFGQVANECQKNFKSIFFVSITAPLGYYLILLAFQISQVSYISSLRQISVLLGVLMGHQLLKESQTKKRFIGALLIVCGIFTISIWG